MKCLICIGSNQPHAHSEKVPFRRYNNSSSESEDEDDSNLAAKFVKFVQNPIRALTENHTDSSSESEDEDDSNFGAKVVNLVTKPPWKWF